MEQADIFKALGNENRLVILSMLRKRQLCVKALSCKLDISQPAVSQHLKVLEHAGLIKADKKGAWVHYSVVKKTVNDCVDSLRKFGIS
ncbi:ArsR/SmtB family transcription factor [Planctomycetota bacterium]